MENHGGRGYSGGITGQVALGEEDFILSDCYNYGSVLAEEWKEIYGAISGYCAAKKDGIKNNYYLDTLPVKGFLGEAEIANDEELAKAKTAEQFKSGEEAYLLNNEVTDGSQVWYQNIDNGETPDAYPVLDDTHGTVYRWEDGTYSNYEKEPVEETYEIRTFEEFKKMGKTILFVSHDLGSIGKYCDRVVLLNKGVKLAEGKPKDMIDLYKRVMAESKMEDSPKKEDGHAAIEGVAWKESMILNPDKQEYGDKKAEIIDFGIFDAQNKITNTVSKFEECTLKLKVHFYEDILNPIFAFTIRDLKGTDLTGTNSLIEGVDLGLVKAGTTLTVTFRQKLPFQKGQYLLQLGCTGYNGDELEVHHRLYDVCCIQVLSKKVTVGYFDLNSIVSCNEE